MSRKVSFNVYLDGDQADALKRVSERAWVPRSAVVRRGIDMAIAELEERLEAEELGRQTLEQQEDGGDEY